MKYYFKDRIPSAVSGKNRRVFNITDFLSGTTLFSGVTFDLLNNISPEHTGDPLTAANMNYASGCHEFPAGAAPIRAGDVLTISGGGKVAPANSKRAQALSGSNTQSLRPGLLKISDTQFFLWTYQTSESNWLQVGTVNWGAKTVSLSANYTQNLYHMSAAFERVSPGMFCLAYTYWSTGTSSSQYVMQFWTYAGGMVSASTRYTNTGRLGQSKPVRCGSSGVLIACAGDTAGFSGLKLITYAGTGAPVLAGSASVGWLTSESQILGLYSYDGGNSRYVLIANDTTGTITYAVPVTVSGTTIALGAQQNITGAMGAANYFFTGSTSTQVWGDHMLMASGNQVQVGRISANGVVSVGPRYTVPVTFGDIGSGGLSNHMAFAHFRDDATVVITGGRTLPDGTKSGVLLELTRSPNYINNGNDLTITEYTPFTRVSSSSSIPIYHAFENAANPGEFLFIDDIAGLTATSGFYFGYGTDAPNSRSVAGIALEPPSNGVVRVQASAKLLADIYAGRAALVAGQEYAAGDNGELAPIYPGSTARAVASALSPTDLLFFGAAGT